MITYGIAFTGHRPPRLGVAYDDETSVTIQKIKSWMLFMLHDLVSKVPKGTAVTCYTGGALGTDTWAAEVVQEYRESPLLPSQVVTFQHTLVLPFAGMEKRWPLKKTRENFKRIYEAADEALELYEEYKGPSIYIERDRYMVNHCNALLAVWDGQQKGGTWKTVDYARTFRPEVNIFRLDPATLSD